MTIDTVFGWWAAANAKAAVIVIVAMIARLLLARASAAQRHLLWALSLGASIATPLAPAISPWRFSVHVMAPDRDAVAPVGSSAVLPNAPPADVSKLFTRLPATPARAPARTPRAFAHQPRANNKAILELTILSAWLVGALVCILLAARSAMRLRRLARRSRAATGRIASCAHDLMSAAQIRRDVRVLIVSDDVIPATWGVVRPVIALPESAGGWPASRTRAVLVHEIMHVVRFDSLTEAIAAAAYILYWCNPLVWCATRSLARQREHACDDRVLAFGLSPSVYAAELVSLARSMSGCRPAIAAGILGAEPLRERVRAMLDSSRPRNGVRRSSLAASAALCLAASVVLGGIQPAVTYARASHEPVRDMRNGSLAATRGKAAPQSEQTTTPPDVSGPATPSASIDTSTPRLTVEMPGVSVIPAPPSGAPDVRPVAAPLSHAVDANASTATAGAASRRSQMWRLRGKGTSASATLVDALLHDEDASVREMAAWSLAGANDDVAIGGLQQAVRSDADAAVRESAFLSLDDVGHGTVNEILGDAMRDTNARLRRRALWYAGAYGVAERAHDLVDALQDADPEIRVTAAWSLGALRAAGTTPALVPLLDDPSVDARKAALWALLRGGDAAARAAIHGALSNGSPVIRALAARAEAGRWTAWSWAMPHPRPRTAP